MIKYRDLLSDTICSPITAPGYSGVAVIRISGERALEWTQKFTNLQKKKPETHSCHLTEFKDQNGNAIDQVLVTYFAKGQSFTGDECLEVSCHGNPLIVNAISNCFLKEGCRTAEKGEFSFRAYYNGKIDLIQAESIHQLVTTNNSYGSDAFLSQLQGRLSGKFNAIEQDLILALSHLEASIDFVEEDIETANLDAVQKILQPIKRKTEELIESYNIGKSLQGSFKILLLGKTNVGKSSLFNRFVENDRAIVTEVAGTTRDIITEQKFIGSHSVEFVDSAGLRSTEDRIEVIGIQKSIKQMDEADLLLYLIDASDFSDDEWISTLPKTKTHLVFNKIDLLKEGFQNFSLIQKALDWGVSQKKVSFVSTLTGQGMKELLGEIENHLNKEGELNETGLVTQARHFNHLCQLNNHLDITLELIKNCESPDILSQELQLGLSEVHQLLGKEYNDEVLDKIFSQFCIGK